MEAEEFSGSRARIAGEEAPLRKVFREEDGMNGRTA